MDNKEAFLDVYLLEKAKEEFKEKGYEKASLREIAKKAGVTTGAIYTRYKNKEALFYTLCQEAIFAMEDYFNISKCSDKEFERGLTDLSLLRKSFARHAEIIAKHVEALDLLLFKSSGSSYENYRESMIQDYIAFFSEKLSGKDKRSAFDSGKSAGMLFRTIASCYVAYIEELVIHGEEEDKVLEEYRDKVAVLVYSIYQSLLQYYSL